MSAPLLSVRGLTVRYPAERRLLGRPRHWLTAVDGADLSIARGSTLALVGESGCGKTSLGRGLLRLTDDLSGEAWIAPSSERLARDPELARVVADCGRDGAVDLLRIPPRRLKPLRRTLAAVFQDPYSSLNPRLRVWRSVAEPLQIHRLASGAELRTRVDDLLERVGIPAAMGDRFPNEFSGGQRQRLGIARALACDPALIVCDEAVSALDVSVQAQILELLGELQAAHGLSYLFISHDLSVVRQVAQRTAVMYLGRIVEEGETEALFEAPQHPYTQALLSAVPVPDPERRRRRILLAGEPPSPLHPPGGCRFHPRCPQVMERCRREAPADYATAAGGHAACFLAESPAGAPLSSSR